MHLVFVFSHTQFYRHFDQAVRLLCQKGNTANVVMDWVKKPNLTDRMIVAASTEVNELSFENPIKRCGKWGSVLGLFRELLNYAIYFHPEHPSPGLSFRWQKYLPDKVWKIIVKPWAMRLLSFPFIRDGLSIPERITTPMKDVVSYLKESYPSVLVVSPFITAQNGEVEYVKAAKSLQIPTVYALASWDNLTTKGTIHVQTDLVFVWNQALMDEAVTLHNVPRQNLVKTGAPTFDFWFEMEPSLDRTAFYSRVGIDTSKSYVVYLCSSRGMIANEQAFILDLAKQLSLNPATEDVVLLVRPHPYNALDLNSLNTDNVRVWPKSGDLPDVPSVKQNYYDTLHYALATVGINTSAMLEAAIADIPSVTIIDERYQKSQTMMGHFRHLVNGDFLQLAYTYEEAVSAIAGILNGKDIKRENRKRFVQDFIRPHGIDRPVSEIFSHALEMVAEGRTASEIMADLETPTRGI